MDMEKTEIISIRNALINSNVSSYEKKVIISTLNGLKNSEKLNKLTKESVVNGLKVVLTYLQSARATDITEERIKRELAVISSILNNEVSEEELIRASFELDCLYYEMGIAPRETDTIVKYLDLKEKNGKTY